MSDNPLVVDRVQTSNAFTGTFILESGDAVCRSIKNQDWLSTGLSGISLALDTAALVSDPIGSLFAMGFGWVLEHLEPLKGWLDDLTGDGGQVEEQLTVSAEDLKNYLDTDLAGMSGEGIDAYRRHQTETIEEIKAAARWAGGVGGGLSASYPFPGIASEPGI